MKHSKTRLETLPVTLRGVYRPPRMPAIVRLLLMTLSLVIIATVSVGYSLGYKINWQAHTFEQTGIIAVTTQTGITAQTYLNGQKFNDHFPVRVPLLFPGPYDVEVRRDGYQPWIWHSYLQPNNVLTAQNVVIIKKLDQMKVITVSNVPQPGSNTGLEAKYGNEMWVSGQFVTRLSQKITSLQWYPDNTHVAYQAGPYLRLFDTVTGITLDLQIFPDAAPVKFGFINGGRNLLFVRDGITESILLYEP